MPDSWTVRFDDLELGPMPVDDLAALARAGQLPGDALVQRQDMAQAVRADEVRGLLPGSDALAAPVASLVDTPRQPQGATSSVPRGGREDRRSKRRKPPGTPARRADDEPIELTLDDVSDVLGVDIEEPDAEATAVECTEPSGDEGPSGRDEPRVPTVRDPSAASLVFVVALGLHAAIHVLRLAAELGSAGALLPAEAVAALTGTTAVVASAGGVWVLAIAWFAGIVRNHRILSGGSSSWTPGRIAAGLCVPFANLWFARQASVAAWRDSAPSPTVGTVRIDACFSIGLVGLGLLAILGLDAAHLTDIVPADARSTLGATAAAAIAIASALGVSIVTRLALWQRLRTGDRLDECRRRFVPFESRAAAATARPV